MQIIGFIVYFILGIIQFLAIMSGFEHWFGLYWLFAALLALIVTYIPIIGTILGTYAAVTVWHWSWLQALGLFFGTFIIAIILMNIESILVKLKNRN